MHIARAGAESAVVSPSHAAMDNDLQIPVSPASHCFCICGLLGWATREPKHAKENNTKKVCARVSREILRDFVGVRVCVIRHYSNCESNWDRVPIAMP